MVPETPTTPLDKLGGALVPEKHVLFIRNQIIFIPLRRKPNDR